MLIPPELIEDYKQNPGKFDFNRGYEAGRIDFNCRKRIEFTKEHSKQFRLGYARGVVLASCNISEDDLRDDSDLSALFHRTADILFILERYAKCKYDDAPECSPLPDFDSL